MSETEIPDELIAIVPVIGEDEHLRTWFLAALPNNLRVSEIGRLVAQMSADGEDSKMVSAFKMLADSEICRAVRQILKDR
jgi:hypothetical protein